MIIFTTILLSDSNYRLDRFTFSSAGNFGWGNIYFTTTSVGQVYQDTLSSANYKAYIGFLVPSVNILPPSLVSVKDVPHDQGLQVQLVWKKCTYDDAFGVNYYYSVWRYDDEFSLFNSINNPINKKEIKNPLKKSIDPVLSSENKNIFKNPNIILQKAKENPERHYHLLRNNQVWTYLDWVPAVNHDRYSYIAPTLSDSSSSESNYYTYLIIFHRESDLYESNELSGYSVDNIPPNATTARITKNQSNMKITWDKVEYGTFEGNQYRELNGIWYKIYSSDKPNFVCNDSTYLTTTTNLEYSLPITGTKKFFKIVVSDKP